MISTKTPNTRLVMKIYSTLAAEFLGLEPGIDPDFSDLIIQHIDSDGLKRYASEIKDAVDAETREGRFNFMSAYPFIDSLSSKIRYATPTVEEQNGHLYGCLNVYLDEPLNADERQLLLTYTQQQYQSDWGRDIAEQEIEVENGTLHLHFGSDADLNVEVGFVFIITKENLVEKDDAMEQKKYEITDIAHHSNPKWHRIRALEYIGEDVEPGDLGGFVENEDNLSQEGVCWIFNDAIACESAQVSGNAVLKNQAVARGTALVSNNAEVGGKAIVQDYAIVLEGYVSGNTHICGNAKLTKELNSEGVPEVSGDAFVYGTLSGSVHCCGEAIILPGTELRNPTPDLFILNGDKVYLAPGENRQDVCPQQKPKAKDIER